MSDVLVDIVDEADGVIGRESRAEAHRLGLLHRFVQVFVIGSDGRVLLQQRSRHKALGPLLFDASVGGHVDAGEGYDDAMRREAAEELGLPSEGAYVEVGRIRDHTPGVENMIGRLYVHSSDGPFRGWEDEAERLEWFSPAELRVLSGRFPYLFTGGVLASIRLYLARLAQGTAPSPEG